MRRHDAERMLRTSCCVLGMLALFFLRPVDARGYVVPPEQLLEFMAESVVGFETLGLTWEQSGGTGEPGEAPVTVEVWCRSGGDVLTRPRRMAG